MLNTQSPQLCVAECGNTECSYRVNKEVQEQAKALADWLTLGKMAPSQIWEFHDYSDGCPGYVKVYPEELVMEASYD